MIYIPKPKLGTPLNTKHPLAKGLVGSFLLNEKTGNKIINSSIGNSHSTNIGADWIPEGLYFDGADRASVPKVLVGDNDAFTICARFNGAAGGIIYGEGYSGGGWALFLGIEASPPYSARFLIREGVDWKAITVGTTTVNDGWHSVSLVQKNKSSRSIYIDGNLEATNTDTVGDISILNTANIGVLERDTFGSYFVGGINQVYIHDRGISGAEAKLYSREPYAIFQPDQQLKYMVFVPAAYILIAGSGQYGSTGQSVDIDKNSKLDAGAGSFSIAGNEVGLTRGYLLDPESGLFTIAGQDVDLGKGSKLLIDSGNYVITGNDADLLKSNLILPISGSFGLTGQNIDILVGLKIGANSGAYTITGQDVTLIYTPGFAIIADSGAYALTGSALNLFHNYRLDAESGSFEISGQNILLLKDYKLSVESGIYNITGQSVSLLKGLLLGIGPGIYNLTGKDIELLRGYAVIADSGVYGLIGDPIELLHSHFIIADPGRYNILGDDIELLKGRRIHTDSGSFGITGQDINFLRCLKIGAGSGTYGLDGQDITLIYSGTIYIDGCLKMVFSSKQPIIILADISNQPTIVFADMC